MQIIRDASHHNYSLGGRAAGPWGGTPGLARFPPAQADSPMAPQLNLDTNLGFTKLHWNCSPYPHPLPQDNAACSRAPQQPLDRQAARES